MKKLFGMLAIFMVALLTACGGEKKTESASVQTAPEPIQEEVYQLSHQSAVIDLKTAKKYDYRNAPTAVPATSVVVTYDSKRPYAQPIEVKFSYANGDTYTYTVPITFGLWKNQAGIFRVVTDDKCTVWLQGQEKNGKFHEFVFYGDPQFNGTKIKPNSYRNLPAGEIRYRK